MWASRSTEGSNPSLSVTAVSQAGLASARVSADDGLARLRFSSDAAWEKWLEVNHGSAGVWIEIAKKGSGIATRADVARMRDAGIETFLIGESFMRERDPGAALQRLFAR